MLTESGLRKLEEELDYLKSEKRKDVSEKSFDDFFNQIQSTFFSYEMRNTRYIIAPNGLSVLVPVPPYPVPLSNHGREVRWIQFIRETPEFSLPQQVDVEKLLNEFKNACRCVPQKWY